MDRKSLLLVTLFVEGGLYVLGLLLMGGSGAFQAHFSLSWSATGYALLLCSPMFVALYISVRSNWEPLARLQTEMEEKVVPLFANCKIIDLALIALLAGLGEELFFRGWMQAALSNRMGIWIGILLASLIFGLMHYLSMTYFIYAFVTGIYLGLIYQSSGNLYIVMAIHVVYDFVALIYLLKKSPSAKTEGDHTESTSN